MAFSREPAASAGAPALAAGSRPNRRWKQGLAERSFRLGGLARLEFADEFVGIVVEGVAAAATADVVGLALVLYGHGAQAAAHDTLELVVATGKRHALL